MSDNIPHLEPDNVIAAPPAPKHSLSAAAWSAIRTLIAERMRKENEQTIEVVGTCMGENMAEIDRRLKPLEERLAAIEERQQHLDNERSRLMLSVRELRVDLFEELASLKDSQ